MKVLDQIPVVVVSGADWPRGRLFSMIEARCNDNCRAHMLMRREQVLEPCEVHERWDRPKLTYAGSVGGDGRRQSAVRCGCVKLRRRAGTSLRE